MKAFGLFALLVLATATSEACVGFTGAYSTFRPAAGNYHVIVLEQNDCKAIAAGSFQLDEKTSVVSNEVEPKVFYVDKNHTKMCELTSCRVFTTNSKGLEFAENASLYIDGKTCRYDRVYWNRENTWDLKMTYRLVDNSAACRQYGRMYSVLLKDIKHVKH